ncbi:MAG: hypothetical protein ACTS2F_16510 [Thainema sp.]
MSLNQFFAGKLQFAELALVGEPDRVLEGRHCSVACHQLAKDGKRVSWFFSPDCIPVGRTFSPETDEEWIANRISNLPNTDLFINFTSFDQVWHWIAYRDSAVELALCFWADSDSPWLNSELEKGNIDQFSYDYKLAVTKVFKSLWNLIKVGELNIIKNLENNWGFPFDSIRSLFVEIMREDIEDEFCACLQRRYIYTASHIKEMAILKRRDHRSKASDADINRLYSLIDGNRPFATWLNRVLIVADFLSEKNASIKRYIENYRKGIDELSKLQIQRECSPDLRGKYRTPSHIWEKGKYIKDSSYWNI